MPSPDEDPEAFYGHCLLHELFESTSKRLPGAVALEWKGDSVSYAELNFCADSLAGWLSRHDARRGSIVGLMFDRSLEMVVAIVGVLKSGAAYLPLLPTWPRAQRVENLRDASSKHLILQSTFRQDFHSFIATKLEFNDCREFAKTSVAPHRRVEVEPTDLAYIIYTSGSTGKPKGVAMHHGGTAMNIALNASTLVREGQRCCFSNKYTFDVHVADIFKPLFVGATIVITRDIFRIPPVDVLSTLPNKIAVAKVPKALEVIAFTGEGVTESAVRPIPVTTRTINIFGATEFFDATAKEIDRFTFPERVQSIGKPLGNYVPLWVVDPETLELKRDGEPGELVVGGRQVARGYINRPEVTSTKFFDAPWSPGSRVYRTGDLVLRAHDGEFEYLGRAVRRVEVRGKRIHLSAVEDALAALPEVACAAAVAREDPTSKSTTLWAFVSPKSSLEAALRHVPNIEADLRPDRIFGVDEWPTTSSGKIDRQALEACDIDGTLPRSLAKATTKQRRVQRIFRDPGELETSTAGGSSIEDCYIDSEEELDDPFAGPATARALAEMAKCRAVANFLSDAVGKDDNMEKLVRASTVAAYRLGLLFFNKQPPTPPDLAPLTLLPTPIPQRRLEELYSLGPVFSRLIDRVSCDLPWLLSSLAPVRAADPWLDALAKIVEEVYSPNDGAGKDHRAETRLFLMRQDYLPHLDGRYLQVEINTIGVAFAGMTGQLSKLHREGLRSCLMGDLDERQGAPLTPNAPGEDYATALVAAHRDYCLQFVPQELRKNHGSRNEPQVCFYCFDADHLELDQRHIQSSLDELDVPSFFAFLDSKLELKRGDGEGAGAGGALFIDGIEASVVYFHSTFSPSHFPNEESYERRSTIELSRAVKVPSLLGFLAGTKKVQELLSNPETLRNFLTEEEAHACSKVFAQQWDPSRAEAAEAVAAALRAPTEWVLKPQREGGGNNFYGQELVEKLIAGEGLAQYVLMSKISADPMSSWLFRGATATRAQTSSELGIFTSHLMRGDEEVLSSVGGAMFRTKAADLDEGGVCAGFGVIDTPFVVPKMSEEECRAAGYLPNVAETKEAPTSTAEVGQASVCLLLLCGLPACGKSSLARALMDIAASDSSLFGAPDSTIEWVHLCYDEVELNCRSASGASADVFDAGMWQEARGRVVKTATEKVMTYKEHQAKRDQSSKQLVLLLDDNMYYRSMRKSWFHFALEHGCAFHQVLLTASAEVCLLRNASRIGTARVPDFSIRHMAEVFEWPSLEGTNWEAKPLVSVVLNAEDTSAEAQIQQLKTNFARPEDFWAKAPKTEEDSLPPSAFEQSVAHGFDLALRKVVSRALAEAPPELAKSRSLLAKAWGARKSELVAQLNCKLAAEPEATEASIGTWCHEAEEGFLRACVGDVANPERLQSLQSAKKSKTKEPNKTATKTKEKGNEKVKAENIGEEKRDNENENEKEK